MATILVTDGDQRAALAIVRSLGRRGHRVLVGAGADGSPAAASRQCAGSVVLPDALRDEGRYAEALASEVQKGVVDVLLPVTEPSLLAVLRHREGALRSPIVPFPGFETFRRASDKAWVAAAAARVGMGVPRQRIVEAWDAAEALPERTEGPVVLKPARSVQGGRKLSVSYVDAGGELRRAARALPAEAFPLLIQERVVGPGTGLFLLRWEGRTRAAFAHRRLREKPPSGGVSVLRESAPLDQRLLLHAERLLEELGWCGVAMVELKMDARTGIAYVMEINGRFWGSLQLAVDAGVDFPGILVDLALGRDPGPPPSYREGVRSRWLLGDLDQLIMRLRRSKLELDLPPDSPGRVRALLEFLGAFRPSNRPEVLRLGDPAPFARELSQWVRDVMR